ncbi:MAG: FISUMP domain-containing protein [Bacteroidota bacterium]|nr:FISUMP domain-containing protein [Bacteroidota bacterium]
MIPVLPPIVFIPSLDIVALIEADFAVERNINLGSYFLSEFNTTIGAEIKNGVWTTTKTSTHTGDADFSMSPDDSGDGFSFSGEARFVLLKPKLNFKINGLIGPNLFVKGFEYNKIMFPPLRAELGFGVSAGAEFKFKIFRKTIADFSVDFFDYRWPFFVSTFGNLAPSKPSNPSPSDNSNNQPTSLTLSWHCSDPENDSLTYDVYFGTDNPPTTMVSSDQTDTSLVRNGLTNGTQYFWKVLAKDNHSNSTVSPVWRFTTSSGSGSSCVGTPNVSYLGKTYNTVQIGSQCWLRENLDVGTRIDGNQNQTDNSTIEKYCYNNDPNNCNTYGGLYQWNEAMQYSTTEGARGICPSGWHIPTYAEFQTLSATVGGDGNALKEIGQGIGGGAGTNTSGFSALLSGYRDNGGTFYHLGYGTTFWSSTEYDPDYAFAMHLYYSDRTIGVYGYAYGGYGFSVRCVKD